MRILAVVVRNHKLYKMAEQKNQVGVAIAAIYGIHNNACCHFSYTILLLLGRRRGLEEKVRVNTIDNFDLQQVC